MSVPFLLLCVVLCVRPVLSNDQCEVASSISAKFGQTCALMNATGGVRCWGSNYQGQLGIGNTIGLLSPPTYDVLQGVSQVATGSAHTCALMTATGGVRCWGFNYYGQLGIGNVADLLSPPTYDVLQGVSQVAAGAYHTCALMTATGGVRCWGFNFYGQLGIGNTTSLRSPPTYDVLQGVSQIAAGYDHTCALMTATGGVRCWGYNNDGQLGIGNTTNLLLPPTSDVLQGVSQIAAGDYHTCALMNATGGVRCWGFNFFGQLGIGNTANLLLPPATDVLQGASQIVAQHWFTCALMTATGGVRCWGCNSDGQLGIGSTINLLSPPANDVLQGVSQVAAGSFHTCALMNATGGVRCWGWNENGELGIGSTIGLLSPPPSNVNFLCPGSSLLSVPAIVGIAVGGAVALVLAVVVGVMLYRKRQRSQGGREEGLKLHERSSLL